MVLPFSSRTIHAPVASRETSRVLWTASARMKFFGNRPSSSSERTQAVVPIFNESRFLDRVTIANATDLLVQQQISRYRHCAFKLDEQLNSFNALTVWVADRTHKPNGGDITLP